MKKYTIVIIGGASSYTPGIVRSIMNAYGRTPIEKLVLQDNYKKVSHITQIKDLLLCGKSFFTII